MPMSPAMAAAACSAIRGLAGLPAEAAHRHAPLGLAPDQVGPAGDAVAVGIVGIGPASRSASCDRLEQAQPDHRLGHARAQHGLGVQRAVGGVGDAVGRPAQLDGLAAGQLDRQLLIGDRHPALAELARDREVLQLRAVGRLADQRPADGSPALPARHRSAAGSTGAGTSTRALSPGPSGGCPRPSLRWQPWQERAL